MIFDRLNELAHEEHKKWPRPNRQWAYRLLSDYARGRHITGIQLTMARNAAQLNAQEFAAVEAERPVKARRAA